MLYLAFFTQPLDLYPSTPSPLEHTVVRKMNTNMYIVQEHAHEYANEYEDKLYVYDHVKWYIVQLYMYLNTEEVHVLFILYVHENEHVHKDE